MLLLPETHKITYKELAPGSTMSYSSLLNDDQAEVIGAGVPTYLKTLSTVGYIQKYGEEKNERREEFKQVVFLLTRFNLTVLINQVCQLFVLRIQNFL